MPRVDTVYGPEDVDLSAGLTDALRDVYVHGQCTALAVMLARRTGFPIIALASQTLFDRAADLLAPADNPPGTLAAGSLPDHALVAALAESFDHAVVRAPGGVLDVRGVQSLREVVTRQSGMTLIDPDPMVNPDPECGCPPGCVCLGACCMEECETLSVHVDERILLAAARLGGWPRPNLQMADKVARLVLAEAGLATTREVSIARGRAAGDRDRAVATTAGKDRAQALGRS